MKWQILSILFIAVGGSAKFEVILKLSSLPGRAGYRDQHHQI